MLGASHFKFSVRPLPLLILAILLPLTLSLGFWQLDRADQKQAIETQRLAQQQAGRIVLSPQDTNKEMVLYREAQATGELMLNQQLLLDNQKYNGTPGYHVLSPLRLQGHNTYVLVNRGWIGQGNDRSAIPTLPAVQNNAKILGRIENVPSVGMRLGEPGEAGPNWPKRVIYADIEWLQQQTGWQFLPYVLYQTNDTRDGLIRDWEKHFKPKQRMTPEKHTGYAVQWFGLSIALVILFLVASVRKISD